MATLVENLLPLMLMTLIMFASLYFPHSLVKEKITVAITAALSGAVLLTATNTSSATSATPLPSSMRSTCSSASASSASCPFLRAPSWRGRPRAQHVRFAREGVTAF